MKLHPTRGAYDLRGVEGAAGPMQLFGLLCACACVGLAATTFGHGPFTIWALAVLLVGHGVALHLRRADAPLNVRLGVGTALAIAIAAATAAVPMLSDSACTPDMQSDGDYFLAGVMVWLCLLGQCYASVPGVLIFALVPELAGVALFGQMTIGPEMPAFYSMYLLAAMGLLSYASFVRRPHGAPPPRRRVVPAPGEMLFGVAVLFAVLAAGGGLLAVGLRIVVPSPFNTRWFHPEAPAFGAEPQPYEAFSNSLSLRHNSGRLASAPVLSVIAPRPVLLRRRVYAYYTGDAWVPRRRNPPIGALDGDGGVPQSVIGQAALSGEALTCELTPIRRLESPLPVAGVPLRVRGLEGRRPVVTEYGTIQFAAPLRPGATVSFTSVERLAEAGGLDQCPPDYPESLIEGGYLQAPPGVAPLLPLARELTAEQPTVAAKVAALQRYIESECIYNLSAPPPAPRADSVVDFLTRRKQGTCADFASALAVLCRLSEIPSRVVTGYAATDPDPAAPGSFLVREKNAHAWVEVFYSGVGWTVHDLRADRAIEGTALERLQTRLRNWSRAVSGLFRRNMVAVVIAVPLLYIVGYELRRRGTRWRTPPRQSAGQALRGLLAGLEPWAPWAMPGRGPVEAVEEAKQRLPAEHHQALTECVAELLELRYGPVEPAPATLGPAARRARALRRRLRGARLRTRARP